MKTAIILLDYIMDIIHPEGKIARSAQQALERDIIAKANRALDIARQKHWLIIHIKVGFSSDYSQQPKHSPMFGRAHEFRALELGSSGTDFHPDLHVGPSDLIITKPRVSAFYGTSLEPALRANSVERLVLAGVSSTWAVQSTARDAHDRDYRVVVVEDACAAASEEEHQASMKMLSTIASIVTVDDLKKL
ncbi:cysteine hydrolase family protein [Brucella pituitosa]|uniref:cysteine hydrolase family protein n=1 Tax=Brucella pituitosa TaxID=571256 RepID=UPI0009A151BF|nr:isochorismatase family cysteine hydrolase [Brucella pituitosa]